MVTGSSNHVVPLRTGAWFGDQERPYAFPAGWEVSVFPPADAPAASAEAIAEAFSKPIGTAPIAELAPGKRSAAIIVDDLSRPTPAAELIPHILRELHQGGIAEDCIRFVVGGGAHRPLTADEIARKLGAEVAARYQATNHLFYSGELAAMGTMEDGTPVFIDPVVAGSDLKLAVGGVIPHLSMGFGGGAKLVVPGVAGFATIQYNHGLFPGRPRGSAAGDGDGMDMREHAVSVARYMGLDAIVNVVLNSRREIAGVFVGEVEAAHAEGVRLARRVYETALPARLVEDASVVVMNAYPQDADPVQVVKASWPWEVFAGARKVMLDAAVDGIAYHGMSDRMDYGRYCRLKADESPAAQALPGLCEETREVFISGGFPAAEFRSRYPSAALFRRWEQAMGAMERLWPRERVVVLPCAPLQLPVIG